MSKNGRKEVAIDVELVNRKRASSETRADYDRKKSLGHVTR